MKPCGLGRYEARIESLPAALEAVLESAEAAGLSPARAVQLELALEEALANVVHHAYGDDGGPLDLMWEGANGVFTVEIADDGPPFNPLDVEEAPVEGDLDDLEPGGLGIFLILKLADEALYRRENDRNVLSLRFEAGVRTP